MASSATTRSNAVDPSVLLRILAQVRAGDFTARMPLEWTGVAGKVADGLNEVILVGPDVHLSPLRHALARIAFANAPRCGSLRASMVPKKSAIFRATRLSIAMK